MGRSSNDQINQETYMGIIPALKNDRIYNFRDITLVSAGFGVASWIYVQGAYVASILPFGLAVFTSLIPMLLGGIVVILLTIIATRYGIDFWIYQRAVFGYKLVVAIFAVAILTTWGWYAINSQVLGGSMHTLLGYAGLDLGEGSIPFLSLLCPLIGCLVAINGPKVMAKITYVTVPCVVFVGILLLVKTLSTTSLEELFAIEPIYGGDYESVRIAFCLAVESTFAFCFGWYPVLGSLSRITKTERSSFWGQLIGMIVVLCFFAFIGTITTTLMAGQGTYSAYPSDWLANFGGFWTVLAQFAVVLGNITTQIVGLYSLTLATKIFMPSWNFKYIAIVYTVYCSVLILWQAIWNYYSIFQAAVAMVAAPACAIIVVDFFLIRKKSFSFKSAFRRGEHKSYNYSKGFNLAALLSFVSGIAMYLMIYDPINYIVRNEVLLAITPTMASWLTAGVVYFILCKVPKINNYVLKDAEE